MDGQNMTNKTNKITPTTEVKRSKANDKNKIPIVVYDSDIELLKAGKDVHWSTRINGKLYKIIANYHTNINKKPCSTCMYSRGQKCQLDKCYLS